jgi:hypothetical protein
VLSAACAAKPWTTSVGFDPAATTADTTIVTDSVGTTASARPSAAERVGLETGAVEGVMGVRVEQETNLY